MLQLSVNLSNFQCVKPPVSALRLWFRPADFVPKTFALSLALGLVGCGGSEAPVSAPATPASCSQAALASELTRQLAALSSTVDFSLSLLHRDGSRFYYSRGNVNAQTEFESASTSKWVSAAAILQLVDAGVLQLSDNPQQYINSWPSANSDPRSQIQLRHLLSFTSGLSEEPVCVNLANADFSQCVDKIAEINQNNGKIPGKEFYYASTHLQVAGLMAIKASGSRDWADLFSKFKLQTNLFSHSRFDLPSATNPRLAGGMHWQSDDYLDFIRSYQRGNLLSASLKQQAMSDQLQNATIAYSPARAALNQDWHYGFGLWLECSASSFNCSNIRYYSSPGAYGAYPFIFESAGMVGLLARQGGLGSFAEGKAQFDSVAPAVEAWAQCNLP